MTDISNPNSSAKEDEAGIWATLRLTYSYPRFQWLVVTIASVSALYLSSQEIWSIADGKPYPEVSNWTMVVYCAFFLTITFLVHVNDVERVISRCYVSITTAIVSILVDLGLLCLSELVVLWSIQVLPQEPLSIAKLLLLGAAPGSLGAVTLSSLTVSTLRERVSRLKREVHELAKKAEELDKKWHMAEDSLASFERKKRAFMQSIPQNGDEPA